MDIDVSKASSPEIRGSSDMEGVDATLDGSEADATLDVNGVDAALDAKGAGAPLDDDGVAGSGTRAGAFPRRFLAT